MAPHCPGEDIEGNRILRPCIGSIFSVLFEVSAAVMDTMTKSKVGRAGFISS